MSGIRRCMSCMDDMGGFDICKNCGWVEGTPPGEPSHLMPRTMLRGRYEVGTVIGFGGFGITYNAWDNTLDRRVAIKEYFPSGLVNRIQGDPEVIIYSGGRQEQFEAGMTRFLAEAHSMAKFSDHPSIVNVTDFFQENSTAYIVMEFLDGITLKQYLTANGRPMEEDEILEVIEPLCKALADIHKAGIIHRDLSPDNIFLTRDGKIKLIDFGAARLTTGEKEETLSVILKPGYAPPEQYRTKSRQGPFTDVYALGATVYRMVTGKVPTESVDRSVEDNLKSPKELGVQVSKDFDRALMKAMALDPVLRFPSATDFLKALKGKKRSMYPEKELRVRRRRNAFRTFLVVLAALVIGAGYFVYEVMLGRLLPTTVTVWMPEFEDELKAESFHQVFGLDQESNMSVSAAFAEEYPHIGLDIRWIKEADYEAELSAAIESGTAPDLFYAPAVTDEYSAVAADAGEFIAEINKDGEYSLLSGYTELFPSGRYLPTGLDVVVLYTNSDLCESMGVVVPENGAALRLFENELRTDSEEIPGIYVPEENLFAYVAAMSDYSWSGGAYSSGEDALIGSLGTALCTWKDISVGYPQRTGDSEISGLNYGEENMMSFLGRSSQLRWVQNSLPGYYGAYSFRGTPAVFTGLFCMKAQEDRIKNAAVEEFTERLYADSTQAILNIQGSGTIPLSNAGVAQYAGVYSDFAFITDSIDSFKLFGENWYLLPENIDRA